MLSNRAILILIGIALMAWIVIISDQRSQELEKAMLKYEECVMNQYGGKSVLEIYHATGEYPECKEQ